MPVDVTHVPLRRPRLPLAEIEREPTARREDPSSLHAEALLVEEFNYAGAVAFHAHEEHNGLLNLYLLLAGVIALGVGIAASVAMTARLTGPLLAMAVGLLLAAVLSFGFFLRLMGLGDEYREALQVMKQVQAVYVQEMHGRPEVLDRASRWRLEEVLSSEGRLRYRSITLVSGLVIAVAGSLYLAVASEFYYHYTQGFGGLPRLPLALGNLQITGLVVDAPVFLFALAGHGLYIVRRRRSRPEAE
jgi:hypothetical protein